MELKFPPPLLFIISAVIIYFLPHFDLSLLGLRVIAVIAMLFGIGLDVASLLHFWQKKTTINPLVPEQTRQLVSHGVYWISRNPMYLSLVLYLGALSLWLVSPLGIMVIAGFMMYLTRFQIMPEERMLAEKFGQSYQLYQAEVRRWFGRY